MVRVDGPLTDKETVMSAAELEILTGDAVDDVPHASTIRTSVREAVEGMLAKVAGSADTRREMRAAGELLGNALVAHAEAAEGTDGAERVARHHKARALPALDTPERRAHAFRTMAGVRL
jgi:hypothetical protein